MLALLLTACGRTLAPDPIPGNTAWTPVTQTINGVDMVQVPPGCFDMGSTDGRRDEQPVHEICFDAAFWIDQTEVTNAQFGSSGAFDAPDHPRENLTWAEARDHCAARGARLPTEAEWEYAARGPDNLRYPWGDALDPERLVFDSNFGGSTAPVLSRPEGVSWVGAHDMAGNVWEWVSSAYLPYPYDASHESPEAALRAYRGGIGSYIDHGPASTTRFRADPERRSWFIGFRCARDG